MPWVRIDDHFDDDPDIDHMSTDAIALHICATTWSSRKLTDGFIPKSRVSKLPGGNQEAIGELTAGDKPWWVEVEGGYQVRNFLKFNPSREEVEADRKAAAARQAAWRARRRQGSDESDEIIQPSSNGVTEDVTDDVMNGVSSSRVPVARIPYPVNNPEPGEDPPSGAGARGAPPGFHPPAEEQVARIMAGCGIPEPDATSEARKFIGHYSGLGWHTSAGAAVRNWVGLAEKWAENIPRFAPPGAKGKGAKKDRKSRQDLVDGARQIRNSGGPIYGQ